MPKIGCLRLEIWCGRSGGWTGSPNPTNGGDWNPLKAELAFSWLVEYNVRSGHFRMGVVHYSIPLYSPASLSESFAGSRAGFV